MKTEPQRRDGRKASPRPKRPGVPGREFAQWPQSDPIERKRIIFLCLALAAVSFACYWPVLGHPFADYDDDNYVTANPNVQRGLTWQSLSWAFTSTEKSNWHPLTWMSHELDCQIYGLNPGGHHFTSLSLHVLNVCLLFLLLVLGTRAVERSWFVALLFAVHPVNVESVAWIAERKNVLSTVVFLLAIGAYGWYAKRPTIKRYVLVATIFGMALASKPMAITLPCVLVLLDFWPFQRVLGLGKPAIAFPVPQFPLRRLLLEKLPLLALSAGSAVVTIVAQRSGGSIKSLADVPPGIRFANAIWAYVAYIGKIFWPGALAPHYPYPRSGPALWQLILAVAVLALVSGFLWWKRSHTYLWVGWCWFFGTLVPVIGLIQVGNQAMADRYLYLPMIGVLVVVVWGVLDLVDYECLGLAVRIVAAVVIVGALVGLTWRQVGYWRSGYDLWSHTLAVTKDNSLAEGNLGVAFMNLGREEEGLAHFRNAARIEPNDPTTRFNLAAVLQSRGELPQAMTEYASVIQLVSGNANAVGNSRLLADAFANLGTLYSETGDFGKARETYRQALQIDPFALDGLIGKFYQYVAVSPTGNGYLWLAEMLEQAGRTKEARAAYERALKLEPGLVEAERGLGQ
jgi:hypothetical protein